MPCRLDVNWSWSPVFVIEKGRKRLGWIYRYNMATHTYDTYVTHVYVYIYMTSSLKVIASPSQGSDVRDSAFVRIPGAGT